jgi:hypothetical protein
MARGVEQGRLEGELRKARAAVLDALDARFGVVSDAVRDRVQTTTDRALLKRRHCAVIQTDSLDAAERAVLEDTSPPS